MPNRDQSPKQEGTVTEAAVQAAVKAQDQAHRDWLAGDDEEVTNETIRAWMRPALEAALPQLRASLSGEVEQELPEGITRAPYFKVTCTQCGEAFPEHESGGGYTLFETEQEAREKVEGQDGEITDDGKVICSTCLDEREPPSPVTKGETDA